MIRLIFVGDAALRNDFGALGTLGSEVLLIARDAIGLVLLWYKALGANNAVAQKAREAVLVELLTLVLHLLHAGLEYLRALVTARRKRLIVTLAAVEQLVFGAERLVDQTRLAHVAEEALVVPVLVLVAKILGAGADLGLALLAHMGVQVLIASQAERILVLENITRAGKRLMAVPAAELLDIVRVLILFELLVLLLMVCHAFSVVFVVVDDQLCKADEWTTKTTATVAIKKLKTI